MFIINVGTKSNGGIKSVIEGYFSDGLYQNDDDIHGACFIPTHGAGSKFGDVILFAMALVKVFFLLLSKKNAVIHAHMSMNGSFWRKLLMCLISKVFFAKFVLHLHGSEFKVFFTTSSFFTRCLVIFLFRRSSAVIVLSENWADYIRESMGIQPVVVNNYVDVRRQLLNRKAGHILFLGAFIKRKGIYDLLQAVKVLSQKTCVHLHLCGGGEDEKVQSLIKEMQLESLVTIHGWVGPEKKSILLAECSALVLPSYNEGLPMVIIEALGSEIPLITTPVGGIPDVINDGHNGLLVNPGEIDALSEALYRVLTDSKLSAKLAQEGSALYFNFFTSGVVFPKVRRIYSDVIRR
ncbi:glycosyltransferase family 4 protein [Chitinibacter tainanensis]|uniref:glycosyltransferase family 4 protein n=1 Tax=Chitinibacter tainanensis TaxID=230667 RepID=UPI000426201E|nr:glycosyltransferase family 4 protein [Chitinibacter tainanensis]